MIDLKEKLIDKISTIKDQNTLEFLEEMLNQMNAEGTFELSEQFEEDIERSILQIKNGEFETHEQVMKRLLNE